MHKPSLAANEPDEKYQGALSTLWNERPEVPEDSLTCANHVKVRPLTSRKSSGLHTVAAKLGDSNGLSESQSLTTTEYNRRKLESVATTTERGSRPFRNARAKVL